MCQRSTPHCIQSPGELGWCLLPHINLAIIVNDLNLNGKISITSKHDQQKQHSIPFPAQKVHLSMRGHSAMTLLGLALAWLRGISLMKRKCECYSQASGSPIFCLQRQIFHQHVYMVRVSLLQTRAHSLLSRRLCSTLAGHDSGWPLIHST